MYVHIDSWNTLISVCEEMKVTAYGSQQQWANSVCVCVCVCVCVVCGVCVCVCGVRVCGVWGVCVCVCGVCGVCVCVCVWCVCVCEIRKEKSTN